MRHLVLRAPCTSSSPSSITIIVTIIITIIIIIYIIIINTITITITIIINAIKIMINSRILRDPGQNVFSSPALTVILICL